MLHVLFEQQFPPQWASWHRMQKAERWVYWVKGGEMMSMMAQHEHCCVQLIEFYTGGGRAVVKNGKDEEENKKKSWKIEDLQFKMQICFLSFYLLSFQTSPWGLLVACSLAG